jgi:hypothetical protein
MELNFVSVLIGIGTVFCTGVFLWYFTALIRNASRYGIPKYLPRDEIVAWTMVMMSSTRHWDFSRTKAMFFEHYDLGILAIDEGEHVKDFDIFPNITDVVVYPGKWGVQYATVVTQRLQTINGRLRYAVTFIGEIKDGELHRGRTASNYKVIS